jgi:hypothetical protein
MELTPLGFWSGIILVLIPQLITLISNWQKNKASEPLTNAQAESAMGDALEKLGQAFDRSLVTIKAQDDELSLLRPMTLKIAMQEQAMAQTQKDKEDWKRYSEKLVLQLQEHEILPIPFRRYPSNGDSQKVKAVTPEQIQAAKEGKP